MFRPNSIRGLLQKRDQSKVTLAPNQSQPSPNTESNQSIFDPQVEHIVQIKCAIKDVDNTISNIRQWREEQKKNLERNLKMNQQLFSKNANDSNLEKEQQSKDTNQELLKFQKKLDSQQKNLEEILRETEKKQQKFLDEYESLLITEMVTTKIEECEKRTNKMKEKNKEESCKLSDQNQAFIESLKQMNQIFHKPALDVQVEKVENSDLILDKPEANQKQIKSDIDEIERQLKQLEDLLK